MTESLRAPYTLCSGHYQPVHTLSLLVYHSFAGAVEWWWISQQQDYGKRYGGRYGSLLPVALAEVTETLRCLLPVTLAEVTETLRSTLRCLLPVTFTVTFTVILLCSVQKAKETPVCVF
eukprot:4248261-Prymnesium_polylepis.1